MSDNVGIISHALGNEFSLAERIKNLKAKKSLSLPIDQSLDMLQELTKFDLGRFLLENKGLNGFWTAYVILNGIKKSDLSPLEDWILNKSPVVIATRERFDVFQRELQKILRDNMVIASTPCGLMDDLLGLDFANFSNIRLKGIDLDPDSVDYAIENIKNYSVNAEIEFLIKDAWVT